jgi:uroporphyrinogen-III synthase
VNVVLTRELGRNEALVAWLPSGAKVSEVPLTTTRYVETESVAHELSSSGSYGTYHALVVTSARTGPYVALARGALSPDAEVFSVGPATTRMLHEVGLKVHAQATGTARDLDRQVSRGPVLVLGAATMRDDLVDALRERGIDVAVIACYETVPSTPDEAGAQLLRDAQVVLIGAPSAWSIAREFVSPNAWVVVPGPTTGSAVRAQHQRVIEGWGPSLRERLATL